MKHKTTSVKLIIIATFLILIVNACKTNEPTIVGVWKPSSLILPEGLKKDVNSVQFINMTFEKSKEICYKFNADGTFEFVSDKDIPGIKGSKGTYKIEGKTMAIDYNNSKQESTIIKLTDTEIQVQSKDSIIVVYERNK
ncbi:MAG: hypothetical protein JWP12_669 [Bacteroidetes bacterium]|nr:hypothetical protein [Bacteroidota bacterium]